jgi:hypothetical protein
MGYTVGCRGVGGVWRYTARALTTTIIPLDADYLDRIKCMYMRKSFRHRYKSVRFAPRFVCISHKYTHFLLHAESLSVLLSIMNRMFSIILSLLPLLALAKDHQPSPSSEWKMLTAPAHHTIPTIFLAGDSKMAPGGGGNGTEGWGQYLHYSFNNETIYINNSAIAGRSARSYTREGRFQKIADALKRDDWVVIEFGTNDGGSPYPASSDNGRADCPGYGLCSEVALGKQEADKFLQGTEICPTVYG